MCFFLLPLKINASIKQRLVEFGPKKEELTTFSHQGYQLPGGEWDTLLGKCIKEKSPADALSFPSLSNRMSNLGLSSAGPSPIDVARYLISFIESQRNLYFLDSKFPLFGFMREVATNEKKHPKLYLWQGEADAIAFSWVLKKYVIVDFKVVDNLSDYWQKKTDLCGKHLHQCLVYAKLLQLHMKLPYLPPSLIVVIHKVTGKEGYFALFEDYPQECYEKLDEYEWFTEQPSKRPLKIASTDKLLHEKFRYVRDVHVPDPQAKLSDIFGKDATVKDLLDSLGHDSLEIFRQEQ